MYTDFGAHKMLDALPGVTPFLAVHNNFPGQTGANEVSTARTAVTYGAAAARVKQKSGAAILIPMPAGSVGRFLVLWDAETGGNALRFAPVNGGGVNGVGIVAAGDEIIRSYAHGLVEDDVLFLGPVNRGIALPAPAAIETLYFAVNVTTDTFQISLEEGGAPVNFTENGELFFQKLIEESFGSAGNLSVGADAFDLL